MKNIERITIAAVMLSAMTDFEEEQLTILGEMIAMAFALENKDLSDETFRCLFQAYETCLEERTAYHRKIIKDTVE